MAIRVQLSPFLRRYIPNYDHSCGIQMEIDASDRVEQIITELNIPREEVISVMINGYPGKFSSTVNDGDTVMLAKVVGGG